MTILSCIFFGGSAIEGGRLSSGRSEAAAFREFWMRTALCEVGTFDAESAQHRDGTDRQRELKTHSMMTRAAMASTIGTALRNRNLCFSFVRSSSIQRDGAPYRGTTHGS